MAVELRKSGEKVNLQKTSNKNFGEITINLNWNQESSKSKGFFGSLFASKPIDLDIGCLYELNDGSKGVVQALGNSFGSRTSSPYIMLDKDDRSGSSSDGENIFVNGDFFSKIKRIVVFTFIYEGAPNWAEANGIVTIKQKGSQDIVIKMDDHSSGKIMCALAYIENNGETVSIERLVKYYSGHAELDNAYKWGMSWVAGSK